MSYTNTTTNYALPQYVASDVPSILSDVNTAYSNIDTAIYDVASAQETVTTTVTSLAARVTTAEGEIDTLQSDLDTAETSISTNASAISTLDTTVSTLSSTVSSNTTNISTNASDIDDLQELVGSETLETTAQTVTGAINELASSSSSIGFPDYDNPTTIGAASSYTATENGWFYCSGMSTTANHIYVNENVVFISRTASETCFIPVSTGQIITSDNDWGASTCIYPCL